VTRKEFWTVVLIVGIPIVGILASILLISWDGKWPPGWPR
jgi:hypothetical protein